VTELVVHPTAKYIKAGAILAVIVVLAVEIAYVSKWRDKPDLKMGAHRGLRWCCCGRPSAGFAAVFTRRRFTADHRLRYEPE